MPAIACCAGNAPSSGISAAPEEEEEDDEEEEDEEGRRTEGVVLLLSFGIGAAGLQSEVRYPSFSIISYLFGEGAVASSAPYASCIRKLDAFARKM
jgi:hypothetical protein